MKKTLSMLLFTITLIRPCITLGTIADEPSDEVGTRYEHYYVDYVLDEKAGSVLTYDWALKVLDEEELEDAKTVNIRNSTSAEKVDIIHAYTLKSNGQKIIVPDSNYQIEANSGKDKSIPPAFSDITITTLVYPELAVGDKVVLSYKITKNEQFFPNHFSEGRVFPRYKAYDDVRIKLKAPLSLGIKYKLYDFAEKNKVEKDGLLTTEWQYSNKTPVEDESEDAQVYVFGSEPGYAISSFENYGQIAEQYGLRANPKAAVTPRIKKLADELTSGVEGELKQATALYTWVAKNINYAGNCIGVGAVVPRN